LDINFIINNQPSSQPGARPGTGFMLICSNKKCSPLTPLVGTKMVRKYYDDKSTYRCKNCKRNYDVEILGIDICPRCKIAMQYAKIWWYKCPKCGQG